MCYRNARATDSKRVGLLGTSDLSNTPFVENLPRVRSRENGFPQMGRNLRREVLLLGSADGRGPPVEDDRQDSECRRHGHRCNRRRRCRETALRRQEDECHCSRKGGEHVELAGLEHQWFEPGDDVAEESASHGVDDAHEHGCRRGEPRLECLLRAERRIAAESQCIDELDRPPEAFDVLRKQRAAERGQRDRCRS